MSGSITHAWHRTSRSMVRALMLVGAGLCLTLSALAQTPDDQMKILVHITHGPEAPTRAALGFHVAKAAVDEGHDVTIFLAGDGVALLREGTLDQLSGLGTGSLRELYDAVAAAGVRFYLSGGSSRARSLTEAELEGKSFQFASPQDLVRLSVEHDRMFVY